MDERLSGLSRDGLLAATAAVNAQIGKRWPSGAHHATVTLQHREVAIETLVAYFASAGGLHGTIVEQQEPRSTPITDMLAALVESNGGMAQTVVAQADQIVSMSKELRELREGWVPRVPRVNLTV